MLALHNQSIQPDIVVCLLNNCSDGTLAVVRDLAPRLGFTLDIVECVLPGHLATGGHARCLAMQRAARHGGSDGVLMTTDSDTVAPVDWVARNLAALRQGAAIVCGRARIDPADACLIPDHLHRDDALERELIGLLDNFAWMLDPEPCDPLPRHTEASGASLSMTAAAFHAIGGMPDLPCGEDRALVRRLWEQDAPVRHHPDIEVFVSGRVHGRAVGGMAETLRRRMIKQDEFTDAQVEPARHGWRRYALRGRVRQCWSGGTDNALATDLAVAPSQLRAALRQPFFGAAWAALEECSRRLIRHRVRFADLPAEIAAARALLPADALAAD